MKYVVYAKVMNPHGKDYWAPFGSSEDEADLYPILMKVKRDFKDTFEELCENTYLGFFNEQKRLTDLNVNDIIAKYATEEDKAEDERVKRCNDCFYFIDPYFQHCKHIGEECDKFISVDDYWDLHKNEQKGGAND